MAKVPVESSEKTSLELVGYCFSDSDYSLSDALHALVDLSFVFGLSGSSDFVPGKEICGKNGCMVDSTCTVLKQSLILDSR